MSKSNLSNISLGSFTENCLESYDPVACSRDITESVFAFLTIIGCTYKVVRLHISKHKLLNQYLIFYAAIIEIILLLVNWIYAHHASLDLTAELFKLFQFLVVCRFYCEVASRISKTEYLYKRICLPFLIITSTYYVILIIVSIVRMKAEHECKEPEWIQLSSSEVALGIIFIAVGIYITNHINNLKTDSTYKRNIRLSLWGIILSFEFSSLISAIYDVLMIVYGEMNRCRGIFVTDAALFTSVHIFVKLTKWLLPIWAMMIIFKPETFGTKSSNSDEEENFNDQPPIIRNSLMGDFKSEFRPRNRSFNYKHLRDPDNEEERRLFNEQKENAIVEAEETPRRKRKKNKSGNSESSNTSSAGKAVTQDAPVDSSSSKRHRDKNRNRTNQKQKKPSRNVGINSGDIEPVKV
eukprot:TCONS_00000815-protein